MSTTTTPKTLGSQEQRENRDELAVRSRRAQREKENAKGGFFSKLSFKKKPEADITDDSTVDFLIENNPTYFTPSFVEHNGKCLTHVTLYNRRGANRRMYYDDILDMIPVNPLDGIEMHLIVNDTSIKGDEKKRIIRKNAKSGKGVIESSQKQGPKEDIENRSTQIANEADMEDFDDYEEILDAADPVIVFNINLVIIGPDKETVEEQVEELNTLLDQRHEGVRWGSLGGDQTHRFTEMVGPVPKDRFQMTSTAENYASINFTVNSGLNDKNGLPIGADALSLSAQSSYFDMDTTLRRQAIVAIPRGNVLEQYAKEGEDTPPTTASIFSQFAANHSVMNGHRVHHFVFNQFNYLEGERFYRPWIDGAMERLDVSKVTINPLQGFGNIEDVVSIYNRKVQQIVNMFNVLQNLNLTEEQRALILSAVREFYFNQKLWVDDAERFPGRTRLVGISNPETYPTLGMFINEFSTMARKALRTGREKKTTDIETLQSILDQSISANRGVLGRPTSIVPPTAQQVYYDFSQIESTNIRQVQFLNLLEYVVWTANRGDMIVVHGMNHLWAEVVNMVEPTIEAAQDKGVRFLYSFDTVAAETRNNIKRADMFDMQGTYYKDLDTDIDWSVVGKCLPDEVDMFETALASTLSSMIRSQLQSKMPNRVLVHRNVGDVNNFVNLNVLI